jgi:hypothetical protein
MPTTFPGSLFRSSVSAGFIFAWREKTKVKVINNRVGVRMSKSSEIIVMEMLEFIQREGGHARMWYVGVTDDPRRRLFDEHQAHYLDDAWIYRMTATEDEARRVEEYFLAYGLLEAGGRWRPDSCAVYAYRKSVRTEP